jgi:hypothetical protein
MIGATVRGTILCVLLAGCASGAGSLPLENPAALLSPSTPQSAWSVVDSPNAPPGTDGVYDDQLNGVGGTGPMMCGPLATIAVTLKARKSTITA